MYSFDSKGPHRVLEALVPGALVPLSGRFEDTHAYRFGVDMSLLGGRPGKVPSEMVETAISSQLSLVEYDGFFHTDMRKGFVSYVDLSERRLKSTWGGSCQKFEFEVVESLATGALNGDPVAKYVVALTAGSVTLYRITRIYDNGLLEKRIVILPRPAGAAGLVTDSTGIVRVRMEDGTQAPLALP